MKFWPDYTRSWRKLVEICFSQKATMQKFIIRRKKYNGGGEQKYGAFSE